ncbi:DMT family transporter [Paucidesulfovibrio longus]|uniref:DMT family transporter n=1 Tax=Paucidesulfovibrio longus TaxID=889 RepID=UPI0003B5242E|nr:DMT family transporter [Paucidesulfovibrio longus]
MADQKKAYLFGLATVLLWSTVATAFKLSLQAMRPAQLLFYAGMVSTLVLAAILASRGGLRDALRCSRAEWLRSLALGALNPFLYYLILFKAYDLLPAQEAQPLNYTWAITLALLSIPLLRQRLSRFDLLAVFVGYAGVVVISTHGDPLGMRFASPLGVALALLSTVVWALYWIFNTRETREPVAALFLNFLLGMPLVGLWCAFFDGFAVADAVGLFGAAYVGLFEMGITFVLWLTALKYSENTAKVGNLIFLSPFLSLVFIHFLLGEEILPSTYAGLGLIVAGLLLQRAGRRG